MYDTPIMDQEDWSDFECAQETDLPITESVDLLTCPPEKLLQVCSQLD